MPLVSICKILVLQVIWDKHSLYAQAHDMVGISDAEAADHILALQGYPDSPKVHWRYTASNDSGIRWGLAEIRGEDLIVFRGTTTTIDIIRDLVAVALPFSHLGLGPIHAGFWDGMQNTFDVIKPLIKHSVTVAGYSLGGAHAAIFTGLLVLSGISANRLVTYGSPRTGFQQFADVIGKVNKCLYVNSHDIIPDLPLRLAIEDYVDFGLRTYVSVSPNKYPESFEMGPFAWHNMMLYRLAMNQPITHPTNTEHLGAT